MPTGLIHQLKSHVLGDWTFSTVNHILYIYVIAMLYWQYFLALAKFPLGIKKTEWVFNKTWII